MKNCQVIIETVEKEIGIRPGETTPDGRFSLALAMFGLLVGLEYSGIVPHVNLVGFVAPDLYREGSYILAVMAALAIVLYTTTYMATAVAGELRKRQRQVVELRERLLEEKTGELESDLLDIPRIETGQIVQEMKEVSLRQAIKNALEGQRDLAKEKGVKIILEIIEQLKEIPGVHGTHIMAVGGEDIVPEIVAKAGLMPRPVI